MKRVRPSVLEVADQTMKTFIAGSVPLRDLTGQHADRVQEVEATASCQVEDLHEDAGSVWAENTRVRVIFVFEGFIGDAWGLGFWKIIL